MSKSLKTGSLCQTPWALGEHTLGTLGWASPPVRLSCQGQETVSFLGPCSPVGGSTGQHLPRAPGCSVGLAWQVWKEPPWGMRGKAGLDVHRRLRKGVGEREGVPAGHKKHQVRETRSGSS